MAYNREAALVSADVTSVRINDLIFFSEDISEAVTGIVLSRDITQASTITITMADYHRHFVKSFFALTMSSLTLDGFTFILVQVKKAGDLLTLVFEDAVINNLRHISGPMTQWPGIVNRVGFAFQLCLTTWTAFVGDFFTPQAQEPLTRGTTQTPNEDTWTCLARLANDVGYRCYSDGHSVVFGPDDWLRSMPPAMIITELSDAVDFIDFDFDVGKPVGQMTVHTWADKWVADPGSAVQVQGLGAATGTWVVQTISRDLKYKATTVTLVGPQPTLPEPVKAGV